MGEAVAWASAYHTPALAHEVVALFHGASRVLDGTLGGGGRVTALLEAGVRQVVAVDRDPEAIAEATQPSGVVRECRPILRHPGELRGA